MRNRRLGPDISLWVRSSLHRRSWAGRLGHAIELTRRCFECRQPPDRTRPASDTAPSNGLVVLCLGPGRSPCLEASRRLLTDSSSSSSWTRPDKAPMSSSGLAAVARQRRRLHLERHDLRVKVPTATGSATGRGAGLADATSAAFAQDLPGIRAVGTFTGRRRCGEAARNLVLGRGL